MATYKGLTGDKLLKRAKDCFKAASEAETEQRRREQEDLAFQIPDNQWDADAKMYRQGSAAVAPRPMLSVSLLQQPIQLIQNQATSASLGVEVHPVSEQADPEVAKVKQDLYRRIERDSNANLARLWALNRAIQCGRGWYRVNTQWDEDGDNPSDQEIVIERILNQQDVYIDPAAQKPDFSDAKWGMTVVFIGVDDFEDLYPGKEVPQNDSEFKAWDHDDPGWVLNTGKQKGVRVVEYFWKETDRQPVTKGKYQREREVIRVKRAVLTARDVLEEAPWNGRHIPLIPVLGRELQPFDGERRWEGIVRPARDAQKFVNVALSTTVERMQMEPKAPWVGAEGQFRGHEDEWDLANVRNLTRLEYRMVSHEGQQAPPPQRAQIDTTGMSLALMAYQEGKGLIQSVTAVFSPSLGEQPQKRESQSGRAILALQQQTDAGTSDFLQSLAKISLPYEARVILDLMPKVYDRPGRVVQVLGAENDTRMVMLQKPYVEKDGRPMPIPADQPPPPDVKAFDLAKGKYAVSVNVGKSFQTRLQQGAQELGELIQALPPQLQVLVLPTYLKFRDTPGAADLAKLVKAFRDKQFPGLDAEEGQQPTSEQLKGQMEQMGQQMEQMKQQLQMAMQALQTKQAEQQAKILEAQLDAQTTMGRAQLEADTRLRIAASDNATKLEIAQLSARVDEMLSLLKVQGEAYKIDAQAAHDNEQAEAARVHDVAMGELGREEPLEPEETEVPVTE